MTSRAWFSVIPLAITILGLTCRVCSIRCKAGWHEWNEACYKVSTQQKPFTDASALCNQDAAKLASIRSPQENEFVHNLTGGKDVFIGLTDTEIEGTFVWSDGSTVVYTNWDDGEPNNEYGIGDCVILVANGKWNDTPCSMWYEYVCKFTNAQTSQQQVDGNAMSKEQFFVMSEDKALAYHMIYKQLTSSLIHCALLCVNKPSCKSINYKSEEGKDEGECQLNDATAEDFPLHVMRSLNSVYSVPLGLS